LEAELVVREPERRAGVVLAAGGVVQAAGEEQDLAAELLVDRLLLGRVLGEVPVADRVVEARRAVVVAAALSLLRRLARRGRARLGARAEREVDAVHDHLRAAVR